MTNLLSLTIFAPFLAALVVLLLPQRAKLAIRLASLAGALVPCATSLLLLSRYDAAVVWLAATDLL